MSKSALHPADIRECVPHELIALPQWVTWKTGLDRNGKPTKHPYQLNGVKAKVNDASTWTTFEQAIQGSDEYEGVGFMFSTWDEFCGIDLDGCRDPDTGTVSPWASTWIVRFDSYTEISPSQTGVKIFIRGKNPRDSGKNRKITEPAVSDKEPGVEIYDKLRYFAVTGQKLPEHPATCEYRQDVIDAFCDQYFPKNKPRRTPAKRQAYTDVEGRAAKYLDKISGAISGNGGHNATFHVACVLVLGFDLTPEQAFPLINAWNAKCKPPWTDKELWHKVNSANEKADERGWLLNKRGYCGQDVELSQFLESVEHGSEAKATSGPLPGLAYPEGQTDAANAVRFIDMYHTELLYIPPWKKWLSWDGQRWRDDDGVGALQRAIRYAKSLWRYLEQIAPGVDRDDLAKVVTFIKSTNQTNKIKSFLDLAAVDQRIVCTVEELNSDLNLLNVVNGTIDLTTGTLRPHNPADRITQLANVAYDPDALCPRWTETLQLIFDGDHDLIRYVQQLLGYSLSGDTGEHLLPIAYGRGNNGKSTIWGVVAELLGDYAMLANDELLLGNKSNHPTEKAALYQKRFVAISEPESNAKLKESRVKELTGDRVITARRMKEDFWSFIRTHTFWLSTNHLPRIDGTDEAVWRRVKLMPFSVDLREKVTRIADFDKWLIQNEGRGIVAWLVRGYRDYIENGLIEPAGVTKATQKYRSDSDPLGDFLAEHCIVDHEAETLAAELYRVYSEVHKGTWEQATFGRAMGDKFEKHRPTKGMFRNKTVYKGVRIRENGDEC